MTNPLARLAARAAALVRRAQPEQAEVKRVTDAGSWIEATVPMRDELSYQYRRPSQADEMMARATQYIMLLASLRADVESACCMRLYRRSRGLSPSARGGRSIPVDARRVGGKTVPRHDRRERLKYLTNAGPGGPGTKAALYAEQAADFEEVIDHPVLALLRRPNPWQTGTDFDYLGKLFRLLAGIEFVLHVDDRRGRPVMLLQLPPQHTRIIPSRESFIAGYVYGRDRVDEERFAADEVMRWVYRPSPFNPYDGMSPAHTVVLEADLYAAANESELALWRNDCTPRYVVRTEQPLTPEQAKQIKAEINAEHRGPRNRGKPFLMGGAVGIEILSLTPKEMEYLAGKADLRKVMRNAYGVPETIMELTSSNRASAAAGDPQFMGQTILPSINRDAEHKTETLLRLFGIEPGEMWFAYDNPVARDDVMLREKVVAYVNTGIFTINEARQEEGYDPIGEEGDVRRYNGVPLSRLDAPPQPTTPPGADGDNAGDGEGDGADEPASDQPETGEGEPEESGVKIADPGPPIVRLSVLHAGHGCGGVHAKADDDARKDPPSEEERDLADALRRWFRARTPELLELVGRGSAVVDGLLRTSEARRSLADAIDAPVRRVFASGWDATLAELGDRAEAVGSFGVVNEAALRYLEDYKIRLAGSVTDTTADAINAQLRAGIEGGEAVADLQARVRSVMADASEYRAEMIARTESRRAMEGGRVAAAQAAGGVEAKEWLLSGNPCPFCRAMAGQRAPLDRPFLPRGASVVAADGSILVNDYADVTAPPLHPGCRCSTGLVFGGD